MTQRLLVTCKYVLTLSFSHLCKFNVTLRLTSSLFLRSYVSRSSVDYFLFYLFRNLDETTKSVYKENVRLSEALSYHMKEGEVLKKLRDKLQEENEQLRGDKELNDMMVQEKIVQVKQQKEQIRQVKHKSRDSVCHFKWGYLFFFNELYSCFNVNSNIKLKSLIAI